MIAKITKAYVRRYRDNEQTRAYVEWVDTRGKSGRTEGHPDWWHMSQLLARAKREGVAVTRETRPSFIEWISECRMPDGKRIGQKWVVATRRTERLTRRYPDSTVVTPKRYKALTAEYERQFGVCAW